MTQILLDLPPAVHAALWCHLLPRHSKLEEAAFAYVRRDIRDGAESFQYLNWFPVPPKGFAYRSGFHFELTDEMKASVIKGAHDLGASVAEFHSHIGRWPARFSPSDVLGFQEFVPHVWWRLKGRPYLAVVVTQSGFDGFVWLTDPQAPRYLDGIVVGDQLLIPTKSSPLSMDFYDK